MVKVLFVCHGNIVEHRLDDSALSMEELIRENTESLLQCQAHGLPYVLIDDAYRITPEVLNL